VKAGTQRLGGGHRLPASALMSKGRAGHKMAGEGKGARRQSPTWETHKTDERKKEKGECNPEKGKTVFLSIVGTEMTLGKSAVKHIKFSL